MCVCGQAGAETVCFVSYFDELDAPEKLQQQKSKIETWSFSCSGSKKMERIVPEREPQQGGQVQGCQPQYILRYNSIQQQQQ